LPQPAHPAKSQITAPKASSEAVQARYARNDRLLDALTAQAGCAINASPGARAYYDSFRAQKIGHNDALRRVANRLVGIQHGCLTTRTLYDESTAWSHREKIPNLTPQLDIY
jgi:hypothetical protein